MTAHAAEFFTLDEVNRLKIIQDVIDRRLTTQMAAQRLGISERHCRRLLVRYRDHGPLGMSNRHRGKPSCCCCVTNLSDLSEHNGKIAVAESNQS